MAKSKRKIKSKRGPCLAVACFCERVIEDKNDGVLTIVRIVDQMTIVLPPGTPSDYPSEANPHPIKFTGLLSFRTGYASGNHKATIIWQTPSGKKLPPSEHDLIFSHEPNGGSNLIVIGALQVIDPGVYWMDVLLGGTLIAQMPLAIIVARSEIHVDDGLSSKSQKPNQKRR
jgi:hypothetical protein